MGATGTDVPLAFDARAPGPRLDGRDRDVPSPQPKLGDLEPFASVGERLRACYRLRCSECLSGQSAASGQDGWVGLSEEQIIDGSAAPPMTPALMERVAVRFRALSDPNRLHLLQLLSGGAHSVNELGDAAGLTLANASKHLSVLCAAGFISRHKEGTRTIYTMSNTTARVLCSLVCRDVRTQMQRELDLSQPPVESRAGPTGVAG